MKINLEFDTVTKELMATMDGQPIEDLYEATFSKCYSCESGEEEKKYYATVRKQKKDKVNKTHSSETVYASYNQKVKTNLLKDLK